MTQAQEACVIAWAAAQQILAVGTSKGNLVLYNLARYQKVPFMGKHTRAVLCAAWSNTDLLAMGASDKQVKLYRLSSPNTRQTPFQFQESLLYQAHCPAHTIKTAVAQPVASNTTEMFAALPLFAASPLNTLAVSVHLLACAGLNM